MLFLHISPDPRSVDDLIPCAPFWQVEDILLGARYVLRRRNSEEVRERAALLVWRMHLYEADLVEAAEKTGLPFPMYPDDAALLKDLTMPGRAFPMRAPKTREGISVPVVVEEGWVEAEDFAVLALLKVDQSLDALCDGTQEDLLVCAGVLLEAYRCLLLAERARGRDIFLAEEFDEFKRQRLEQKKRRISEQNRMAPKKRKPEKLKASVLEEYRNIRSKFPEKGRNQIADEIADRYMESLPNLDNGDCKLSPGNARRTIRDWIKRFESQQTSVPPHPVSSHEARKALRNKHRF